MEHRLLDEHGWQHNSLEDGTEVVFTAMHIKCVTSHGPTNCRWVAREPELWILEDVVTIGGTSYVRPRSGGGSISIVLRNMNFSLWHVSS
jgi:hypothetical protein